MPVGRYAVTAEATDNKGGVTTTPPFTVTVLAQMKGVFYIHPDHLGTPRLVTDDKNKIIWKNDPLGEPFGATVPDEDPDGDSVKFALNLRFPGQYFDQETNTHYNYYRDNYLPDLGRYGQGDPVGLKGGINTYTYVSGNPLSKKDSRGLFEEYAPPPGYITSTENFVPPEPGREFFPPNELRLPKAKCMATCVKERSKICAPIAATLSCLGPELSAPAGGMCRAIATMICTEEC